MSYVDSYTAEKMQTVFHDLYLDMHSAFSKCTTINEPTVKTIDSWTKLPLPADLRHALFNKQSLTMNYFPDEIQHHILNEPGVTVTYKFSVGSRDMVLHFVEFNVNQPDLKKMQAHATRVCALMHLVSMHALRDTCSTNLNIFIYMTEFKKRFPERPGETLDTEHANTGMAYHCTKNNEIIVYRKEEWFKVLIHESFHAFGLSFIEHDLPNEVDRGMQRMLQKMYAISQPVRIYETYCEIWARILNVVFDCFADDDATPVYKCVNKSICPTEFKVFVECVMEGIETNARFSQQQYAKLLQYTNISHETLTQPTEENRAIVRKMYHENTNVFAYIVLTCVLINSAHDFMVWCYKNNPFHNDKRRIMQFRTIPSNFNGFIALLDHCKRRCPTPTYKCQLNDVIGSSMRMTSPIVKHEN